MSYSRRNWSDLSSLAKQRTLEDEEEQQRERRRKHRSLLSSSSSVDEEPPSPVKDPSPTPSRPQSLVKPASPEEEEERKLSEVLKMQEGRRTRSPMAVSEKPKQEKEQREAVQGASCEQAQPHTGQESGRAAEQGQRRLQDKEGQGAGTPRGEQRRDEGEPQQQAAPELGTCRVREVKILTRTRIRSTDEKIASEGTPSPDQQRSGSVRSSVTVQKSLVVTSEGVASKRNFFETSAPSKAEPLAAKKDNLKIPGSVTSRINLWISRTQEPAKEEKSKDVGKINSLPKRDVWVKQPRDAPAGTKVDVELR
ncbi:Ladinin-1 [Anas platyrhynchos]|uniref:Ladinin-1 n=1 Tax=Anas platyrhynchos TaxID=8839 RepID=R0K642_ANAPL|nr:Ladinin-1 [Anas platyrhynchos]